MLRLTCCAVLLFLLGFLGCSEKSNPAAPQVSYGSYYDTTGVLPAITATCWYLSLNTSTSNAMVQVFTKSSGGFWAVPQWELGELGTVLIWKTATVQNGYQFWIKVVKP